MYPTITSVDEFMEQSWKMVKEDIDWLEERTVEKGHEILDGYRKSFETEAPPLNEIIENFPEHLYGPLKVESEEELKQKCVDIVMDNLGDLNGILGTDHHYTRGEVSEFVGIGYAEAFCDSFKEDCKKMKYTLYASVILPLAVLPLGLNEYFSANMISIPIGIALIGTDLAVNHKIASRPRPYAHKDKSYFPCELGSGQTKFSKYAIIHEFTHIIQYLENNGLPRSAMEGTAIYSHNVITGKYESKSDLDKNRYDFSILNDAFGFVDECRRKKVEDKEFGEGVEIIKHTEPYYAGYSSILYNVEKFGQDIIPEILGCKG